MKLSWQSIACAAVAPALLVLAASEARAQVPQRPFRINNDTYNVPSYGQTGGPGAVYSGGQGAYYWPSTGLYRGRYNYPTYNNSPYFLPNYTPVTYDPGNSNFAARQYYNPPNYSTVVQSGNYQAPATNSGTYYKYFGNYAQPTYYPSTGATYYPTGGTYYGPGYAYP